MLSSQDIAITLVQPNLWNLSEPCVFITLQTAIASKASSPPQQTGLPNNIVDAAVSQGATSQHGMEGYFNYSQQHGEYTQVRRFAALCFEDWFATQSSGSRVVGRLLGDPCLSCSLFSLCTCDAPVGTRGLTALHAVEQHCPTS